MVHLERTPLISLAYVVDHLKPVYAECRADIVSDQRVKERIWRLFKDTPEPQGYDPGMIWPSETDPEFGLIRLQPWLIRLYDLLNQDNHRVWRA